MGNEDVSQTDCSALNRIIAFANSNDGMLYIGISDHGDVIGVADPDETIQQIAKLNNIRASEAFQRPCVFKD